MNPLLEDCTAAETVRARIPRARVAEMLERGWLILGPGGEGCLLMEGPEPDGAPAPLGRHLVPLASAAWDRAVARLEASLEQPFRAAA